MSDRKVLGEDSGKVGGGVTEVSIPLGVEPDGPRAGPKENWHDAFTGEAAAIINDPVDGMPRPDDTGPMPPAPAPLSPETLVCLEDESEWLEVWREDATRFLDGLPARKSRSFLRSQYDEEGKELERRRYRGDAKIEKRWGNRVVVDNGVDVYVQPKRHRCEHLCAFISPVTDVDVQGKAAEPIFMFCDKFRTVGGAKMSLFDETVTACTERYPSDPVSLSKVKARIDAKIEAGRNRVSLPIFKQTNDGVPVSDWESRAASHIKRRKVFWTPPEVLKAAGLPSTMASSIAIVSPSAAGDDASRPVALVVLPDETWQPASEFYEGRPYGLTERWGVDGRDERLLRMNLDEPTFEDEDDAATWPAYRNALLPISIMRNASTCAKYLAQGKNVDIVASTIDGQGAFFAAVVWAHLARMRGLDALEHLERAAGQELASALSFRVFLRNIDCTA